jgi:hypothetical protein
MTSKVVQYRPLSWSIRTVLTRRNGVMMSVRLSLYIRVNIILLSITALFREPKAREDLQLDTGQYKLNRFGGLSSPVRILCRIAEASRRKTMPGIICTIDHLWTEDGRFTFTAQLTSLLGYDCPHPSNRSLHTIQSSLFAFSVATGS